MNKLKIAVLFGGRSGEHEVSLVSATSIIGALDKKKYEIIPIGITKTGKWVAGKNVMELLKKGKTAGLSNVSLSLDPAQKGVFIYNDKDDECEFKKVDIVFPVLHGPYGEDGTVQGMLEIASIPYVGCDVFSSSACMDKLMSKQIFLARGLSQVEFLAFTRSQIKKNFNEVKKEILKKIGFPCFTKPSNMGSSVGISKVKKEAELKKAMELACEFDNSVVVEKGVEHAREIECAVLGNSEPKASVAGEVVPNREFYDFYAKYVDNASKLFIPAKLSAADLKKVQELAIAAFKAMQCSGMARVDFLMDSKTGKFYLNELNTIPGFTSISMYPKLWAATGVDYGKLIDKLLALAVEKYKEKQSRKTTFESGSEWYK